MNELDPAVIGVLGMLLPPIIAIINRARWGKPEKALVAASVAIFAGLFAAWYQDALTPEGLTASVVAVYTWMQVTYQGFFKQVGLTDWVEHAVLPGEPRIGEGFRDDEFREV